MTADPTPTAAPEHDAAQAETVTQGSSLGLLAMLLGLAGVFGCLTTAFLSVVFKPESMLAIPVTALCSVLALFLGVTALFRAKRGADGRAQGRGPAGIGAFLGAAGSAIQVFVIVAALGVYFPIKQRVVPMMETMTAAVAADDFDAAYALLGEAAQKDITPEAFAEFWAEFEAAAGNVQGVRFEIGTIPRNAQALNQYPPDPDADNAGVVLPRPIEVETGRSGYVFLGLWIDEPALNDDKVLVDDLLAFLPNGMFLILRPDGPASDAAGLFEVPVIVP